MTTFAFHGSIFELHHQVPGGCEGDGESRIYTLERLLAALCIRI